MEVKHPPTKWYTPGVYVLKFTDHCNRVLGVYVGSSSNLARRWRDYARDVFHSKTLKHAASKAKHVQIEAIELLPRGMPKMDIALREQTVLDSYAYTPGLLNQKTRAAVNAHGIVRTWFFEGGDSAEASAADMIRMHGKMLSYVSAGHAHWARSKSTGKKISLDETHLARPGQFTDAYRASRRDRYHKLEDKPKYWLNPKVKAYQRAYGRDYRRSYRKRDYVIQKDREYARAYRKRPDVEAYRTKYMKEYDRLRSLDPGWKEYRSQINRSYRLRKALQRLGADIRYTKRMAEHRIPNAHPALPEVAAWVLMSQIH
jgi:hypothetical protein